MLFRMLYDDKLAQASYLIGCQRTGEALIIDPERDVERYIKAAAQEGMRLAAITETHIHADFLSGCRELAEATGAKLYLSDEGDADWKYQWLHQKSGGGSYPHELLKHGSIFKVGNIQIQALHTPGHTPEHMSFMVTDLGGGATEPMGIATGDFVFVGDVGRPDLLETAAGQVGMKEKSARTLFHSLQEFKKLPDYLQLWPGHGAGSACGKALGAVPQSTVGYEKRFNASLAYATEEGRFVEAILDGQSEPPFYFSRMKRDNKLGPALLGKFPAPQMLDAAGLSKLNGQEATIVDTRPWSAFVKGHLKGALHAPFNNAFPTITGSYILPDSPIYLIIDSARLTEAVTMLIRIGLDNVAGYATPTTLADYQAKGGALTTLEEIDAPELQRRLQNQDLFVLDVRAAFEYELGHLPNALNVAHTRIFDHLTELPKQKTILVHCQTAARSRPAAAILARHGHRVVHLAQGYRSWVQAGGETAA